MCHLSVILQNIMRLTQIKLSMTTQTNRTNLRQPHLSSGIWVVLLAAARWAAQGMLFCGLDPHSFVRCGQVKNQTVFHSLLCIIYQLSLKVMDVYAPGSLSIQAYCALTLVPLVLICQIRNLKYLVPFSGLANVMLLIVYCITSYYVFTDLPPIEDRNLVAGIGTWPLFLRLVF